MSERSSLGPVDCRVRTRPPRRLASNAPLHQVSATSELLGDSRTSEVCFTWCSCAAPASGVGLMRRDEVQFTVAGRLVRRGHWLKRICRRSCRQSHERIRSRRRKTRSALNSTLRSRTLGSSRRATDQSPRLRMIIAAMSWLLLSCMSRCVLPLMPSFGSQMTLALPPESLIIWAVV